MSAEFRRNSIDTIRILAALQVAVYHLWTHIDGLDSDAWFARLLAFVPGVPIFFSISGFVITAAWLRDRNLPRYAISRALRLLPALYGCILFAALAVIALYGAQVAAHRGTFLIWVAAQLAFLTSWNPGFLRGFGVGVVNGSLWTIPVEILFYVAALPLLSFSRNRMRQTVVLIVVAIVSLAANVVAHHLLPTLAGAPPIASKIATVSPVSFVIWIWMFCVGALASIWHERLIPIAVRYFWVALLAFLALSVVGAWVQVPGLLFPYGNHTGLLNMLALCFAILGLAYRFPHLGHGVLRGNDLSYGLYRYHMPALNIVVQLGIGGLAGFWIALFGSLILAAVSWLVIERPAIVASKRLRQRIMARSGGGGAARGIDPVVGALP